MEKTQVMVYFSMFADEFPLNALTKQLGIEPTESYKKGDIIKKISPTENYVRSYTVGSKYRLSRVIGCRWANGYDYRSNWR